MKEPVCMLFSDGKGGHRLEYYDKPSIDAWIQTRLPNIIISPYTRMEYLPDPKVTGYYSTPNEAYLQPYRNHIKFLENRYGKSKEKSRLGFWREENNKEGNSHENDHLVVHRKVNAA